MKLETGNPPPEAPSLRIRDALREAAAQLAAAGADESRLDTELLLMHALRVDRARLYQRQQEPINALSYARFQRLLARRLAREPVPYITGRKEFFGLEFEVTPAALIPRPETETLVERVLAYANERGAPTARGSGFNLTGGGEAGKAPHSLTIADVGTGSGVIAVSLAVHLPGAEVIATDVSKPALALAARNAMRHGVAHRIAFVRGNLTSALPDGVDVIAANLPYVRADEWRAQLPEIREHEPRRALDGGPDGLRLIRRLLREAPACLGPGGALFAEIGHDQGEAAAALARRAFPAADVRIAKDLAGRDRVLCVVTKS